MRARMRLTAAISVLLASGGLLAGCGGGTHAAGGETKPSTTSTAAKTSHAAQAGAAEGKTGAARSGAAATLARASAQAFANAVNLRVGDVPGFHTSPKDEKHTAGEQRIERELLFCVGSAGAGHGLVASGSGTFQRQASIVSQSLSSEVSVAQTPALAARQLAAFRSGLLRKCLSHYVSGLLDSQRYHGAKISPVTTKQGSPPAAGTAGSFGLRFTANLTLHSVAIPLYIDILGFVDGSAEVSLFATGIPEPVPAKIEERLFSLLLARAKSHKT
jgi:hypothetical protein